MEQTLLLISRHAVTRLRQRIGLTRMWSWSECCRWMQRAAARSPCRVTCADGEIQIQVRIDGRYFWLATVPSHRGDGLIVRTVLPHAFAYRNHHHEQRS